MRIGLVLEVDGFRERLVLEEKVRLLAEGWERGSVGWPKPVVMAESAVVEVRRCVHRVIVMTADLEAVGLNELFEYVIAGIGE